MRKTLLRTLVVVAVLALVGAGAAQALKLRIGNIVIVADGGFSPTTLPKHENAPIKLFGHAKFSTVDGTRPSPLRRLVLEFDKHGAVETRGLRKMHDGEAGRDDDQGGAQALPRRDRRHRLRHGAGRTARTGADRSLLAADPVQRAASSTATRRCSAMPTSTTPGRPPTSS